MPRSASPLPCSGVLSDAQLSPAFAVPINAIQRCATPCRCQALPTMPYLAKGSFAFAVRIDASLSLAFALPGHAWLSLRLASQCLALPCLCTAQGRIVKPCLSFALHSTAFQCVAVHAFAVHGKSSRHAATPLRCGPSHSSDSPCLRHALPCRAVPLNC